MTIRSRGPTPRHIESQHPKLVVTTQEKNVRRGKVLIDWSQNTASKTTVSVYSLRAGERPRASTPLTWEEVERAWQADDAELLSFTPNEVLQRLDDDGDLFAPVAEGDQVLPGI